jgi:glycolate oxidase FAD binding subunit
MLTVRLSGAGAAVDAAVRSFGGEQLAAPAADAFWAALREQTHDFFQQGGSLWRLSVPSMTGALVLEGSQMIEWGGAQRWLKVPGPSSAARAATIRASVRAAGGHATLFRRSGKDEGDAPVFEPLAPAIARIHTRLKAAFDPANIFNPGRMF